MMIFLEILKWIGLSILFLLAFVIFLILLILLVPICYKGHVSYKNQNPEEKMPKVEFKVSFLLILLRARAYFDGNFSLIVRVLGFPVIGKKKTSSKDDASKEKDSYADLLKIEEGVRDEDALADNKGSAENEDGALSSQQDENAISHESEPGMEQDGKSEDTGKTEETINEGESGKEDADEVLTHKSSGSLKDKLNEFYNRILCKKDEICGKIKNIWDNIDFYLELLDSQEFKNTLALVKKKLGKLFKILLPRKLFGRIDFGFPDPSTCGQVYAYASLLYLFYGKHFEITPIFDVEETTIDADISFKGHFSVITILMIALKVYFNKDLKKVLFKDKNKDKYIAKKNRVKNKAKGESEHGR